MKENIHFPLFKYIVNKFSSIHGFEKRPFLCVNNKVKWPTRNKLVDHSKKLNSIGESFYNNFRPLCYLLRYLIFDR